MGTVMDWNEQRLGRDLKLRDLSVLLTVARCGSMGKAAAELAVSQPAVSKAIAEMEFTLGVRLLDRGPQGVEPTIYARALLDRGLIAFDELRQAARGLAPCWSRSFPAGIPALSFISWPPNMR
jgi:DNA-binding transcriptional LysR family regulator